MEFNVVAKLKVMPESPEVDLDGVKAKSEEIINAHGKLHSSEVTPIAFGLSALILNLLLNDNAGGMDEIEEGVRKIDGVADVTVEDLNRL